MSLFQFAAYWRSAASGSQSHSDIITATHPPPLHSKSKSKPPSKATRAPGTSRGGRGRAPASEDDVHDGEGEVAQGVDEDVDEMDLDDGPAPPLKPSTRSRAAAKSRAPPATKPASNTKPTTAKAKPKSKGSPARTKKAPAARAAATRGKKNARALFLPSDDEDNDEFVAGSELDELDGSSEMPRDESAAAVAAELGVGVRGDEDDELTGTSGTGRGERAALAVGDDERADTGMTATLRSTAGTQLRRDAVRGAKRRAAAALGAGDDDDSDDAVFKGFGGRKRGRVR